MGFTSSCPGVSAYIEGRPGNITDCWVTKKMSPAGLQARCEGALAT